MRRHSGGSVSSRPMVLMDHLRELQRRLIVIAAVFVAGSGVAYAYKDPLINLLLDPLAGQKLVYLNPAGGFNFIFLISIYAGLVLAVPFLIHQLYGFVRPLLSKKVQHYSTRVLLISLGLLIGGVVFGYIVAIPGALNFLYAFATDYVEASLTADSYLNFIIAYTLGLGLVFQLPLLLMLIHWIKPLTPKGLLKSERWVVLLSFIAAAIITPTPDPLNQVVIALPIVFIYQLGVGAVLISIARAKRATKKSLAASARIAAIPVPQTAAPTPIPVPIATVPLATAAVIPAVKPAVIYSIDGFRARRSTAVPIIPAPRTVALHLPERATPQRNLPDMRTISRPGRRGLSLDGISPMMTT